MRFNRILNHVEKHKSFVYGSTKLVEHEGDVVLKVPLRHRKNARPVCSRCGRCGPVHDRSKDARWFQFVPLWGIAVFFVYRMRRVKCAWCKEVVIEQVPWATGKHQMTNSLRWFLAEWGKRMSWNEVARVFRVKWESVFRSVQHAVEWGLARRDLLLVTALGVDEISWRRGHHYLTLVYDISGTTKRLLAVAQERTQISLNTCLDSLGAEVLGRVRFVCSDMWQPYLTVIAVRLSQAVNVLDRFHIMQKFGKAIDEIRAAESKQLVRDGYEPVLKKSRWCLLKNPQNLTERQTVRLSELMKYNLKSVRAYLQKEDFQRFWDYVSPHWAGKFLDEWTTRVMRSRLEPMKGVARMLRNHREVILNWFRAKGEMSSGSVEALNSNVKLVTKRARGFRSFEVAKTALLHAQGHLPTPEFTHRFC